MCVHSGVNEFQFDVRAAHGSEVKLQKLLEKECMSRQCEIYPLIIRVHTRAEWRSMAICLVDAAGNHQRKLSLIRFTCVHVKRNKRVFTINLNSITFAMHCIDLFLV